MFFRMNPLGIADPDLAQWFLTIDMNRNGAISADELRVSLTNKNWQHFNSETVRLIIEMFDKDNSATINGKEFQELWKYVQNWEAVFDRFDGDRSGNINMSELENAGISFGYKLSKLLYSALITEFDTSAKGGIDIDDFIQCFIFLRKLNLGFGAHGPDGDGVASINYEQFLSIVL